MESFNTDFTAEIHLAFVVTTALQGESPCALADVPAGKHFYVMPEHIHPASPTTTDLLKY